MKFAGADIAQQEAEYQRAVRESQTSLLDMLIQVGIGMLLDMIGYNAIVGCLGGSVWDCVDLATNFLGPLKALKMAKSLYRAADRACWLELHRAALQTAEPSIRAPQG